MIYYSSEDSISRANEQVKTMSKFISSIWNVCGVIVLLGSLSGCISSNDHLNMQSITVPNESNDRLAVQSITVFGDSFNDVGTFQGATNDPANLGKATVNPGNIWVENIATYFNVSLKPNRSLTMDKNASSGATKEVGTAKVLGGKGYAESGARIAMLPSQSGVGNNQLVAPVKQQIANHIASKGKFTANELVIVDGGTNDTYAQFSALCFGTDDNGLGSGNTTLPIANDQIVAAANAQVDNIENILANGAPLVLVGAAADWTNTPFANTYLDAAYQATNCATPVSAQQITEWTNTFNQILKNELAQLPSVTYMDMWKPMNDAITEPTKYSLANVHETACINTKPTSSGVFCTQSTLAAPNAAQTWLWSDSFHPTPRGHQIISDLALSLLEPVTMKAQ